MNPDHDAAFSEVSRILANYDLGDLVALKRNELGYINTSYMIETINRGARQRYFFRRYKSGIQEMEIKFEHSLINHLLEKNFSLIARVHGTKQGPTYWQSAQVDDQDQPIFYAIFDFLPGDDKYTCVDPHCTLPEIKNSAVVQARFHHAVADFSPEGLRFQPKMIDLLPQIPEKIDQALKLSKRTVFDSYLNQNAPLIIESCQEAGLYFADLHTSDWTHIVIHCDFHPGNLKFAGEEVVGLFDFDWSKVDLRSFDVALGLWYFFADWRGDQDGVFRVDEGSVYLREYQAALRDLPNLDPMTAIELQNLPMMILLGDLFVINWAVTDFYSREVDPEDYRMWLRHCVNFIHWFSDAGRQLLQEGLF